MGGTVREEVVVIPRREWEEIIRVLKLAKEIMREFKGFREGVIKRGDVAGGQA